MGSKYELNSHNIFVVSLPLVAQWVKNPSAMQEMREMRVQSLGQEDALEEGMTTRSSILAWQATVHEVKKSWTHLSNSYLRPRVLLRSGPYPGPWNVL